MNPYELKAIRDRAATPILTATPILDGQTDRATLLRLLDDLTGDLLAVEWRPHDGYWSPVCPRCGGIRGTDRKHEPSCRVDARLTQLGLATQAERDAERARRAGK